MSQIKKNLYIIIPAVAIVLVLVLVVIEQNNHNVWESLSVHSVIEAVGAFAALLAGILLYTDTRNIDENLSGPALGFIGMGIWLLLHAIVSPGNAFVFLNNTAMLIGSLGFLLTLIFKAFGKLFRLNLAYLIGWVLSVLAIGVLSITFQDRIPAMTLTHGFTLLAKTINNITGIIFFICSVYYFIRSRKHSEITAKIFFSVTLLFAASTLTFQYSAIWHYTWWLWHLIRAGAYFALILFILIRSELHKKLITSQNEEISDINEKLKNYSYTISHDLKEPIRSIRTFSEFLQEDYEEIFDDTAKDYFNRIINASTKMAAMIDDMLVLSRVGRTDVEFTNVSAAELIEEVKESLFSKINESGAKISYDKLPKVYAQPVWLKNVFLNLISNSIKYKNPNLEKIDIKIKCRSLKRYYEFSVTDNGKGIPKEQHEKVFGLFRKAHTDRNMEGSGAGLAIAAAVVAQHKGKIWVAHSMPYVGTTIKFTIAKEGRK